MNLNELFELQAKLDERIYKEHPVQEGEDRLAKKILALQVELGELANEWMGFKYWSHDQEPRTKTYKSKLSPGGEFCRGIFEANPLLEEYVDCLHFILSIGLDLRMDEVADELDFEYACRDIIDCFVYLNSYVTDLYYVRENDGVNSDFYESLFSKFIRLGELLGFTWDQVEQAYLAKNKINHARQNNGY